MAFQINQELCIQCGQCLPDCPGFAIQYDSEANRYAILTGRCNSCSHCACICPMNAVEDGTGLPFAEWENPKFDPDATHAFLAGKRSVRQFHAKEVPREVLEQMIAVGEMTSTSSNAQDWHATILLSADKKNLVVHNVQKMESLICGFVQNRAGRALAKLVPEGRTYLQDPDISEKLHGLAESLKTGEDGVFYNAPAVVVLSTDKGSAMGGTNCVLAAAAMMYDLQARGIGSCYIGFAQIALNRSKRLRTQIGIPPNDKVHVVFALGYSKVKYRRLPHRQKMPVNFI